MSAVVRVAIVTGTGSSVGGGSAVLVTTDVWRVFRSWLVVDVVRNTGTADTLIDGGTALSQVWPSIEEGAFRTENAGVVAV